MARVTYLFGAGATQAELNYAGVNVQLLPAQIKDGVLERLRHAGKKIKDLISNDLATRNVDIEQLISLYESTGIHDDINASRFLRKAYIGEIAERMKPLDQEEQYSPKLMSALFELHKHHAHALGEELAGVLTLNYDDFAERALVSVRTLFTFGFKVRGSPGNGHDPSLALLKLHGSLNWTNALPPRITSTIMSSDDSCLWIPPGVEKKRDRYPFSILWGKAREALDCQILRVIGCSLSRNDWHLISLLHSSKRTQKFQLELIDYDDVGTRKQEEYPYLGILTLLQIPGFRKYLSDQTGLREAKLARFVNSDNAKIFNCMHEWIRFKKAAISVSEQAFEKSTFIKQV